MMFSVIVSTLLTELVDIIEVALDKIMDSTVLNNKSSRTKESDDAIDQSQKSMQLTSIRQQRSSLNASCFDNSSFSNSANSSCDQSLVHGRSKRNRRACQLLMGNDFINPSRNSRRVSKQTKNSIRTDEILLENDNPISNAPPVKFSIGCLVWARISGHPWWPCMVCNDSNDSKEYTRLSGPRQSRRHNFVEFFGPTVEHAWIADTALIEYKGMDEFKKYAQKQVDEATTKVIKEKLAERFQLKVALSKRSAWEDAVKEADEVVKLSITSRLKWRERKLADVKKNALKGSSLTPIQPVQPSSNLTKESGDISSTKVKGNATSVDSSSKRRPSTIRSSSLLADTKIKSMLTRRPKLSKYYKNEPVNRLNTRLSFQGLTNSKKSAGEMKCSASDHSKNKISSSNTLKTVNKEVPEVSSKKSTLVKDLPTIKRIESCTFCKTSFSKSIDAKELATHILNCSKDKSSSKMEGCPFCSRSFKQSKWSYHKIRCHVQACAKKVYGKPIKSRPVSAPTDQRRKLRPLQRHGALQNASVHTANKTCPTFTRRLLVKPLPSLISPRSSSLHKVRQNRSFARRVRTSVTIASKKYDTRENKTANKSKVDMIENISCPGTANSFKNSDPTDQSPRRTLKLSTISKTSSKAIKLQERSNIPLDSKTITVSELIDDTLLKSKKPTEDQIEPCNVGDKMDSLQQYKSSIENNFERSQQLDNALDSIGDSNFKNRFKALEALAKGLSMEDVACQFKLSSKIIEMDFYGDFSSISDKAVILGRIDLACCDIVEGSRASIASLKYKLPYKYLLMIIRGKSQDYAVSQFYSDFEQWKEKNLKRTRSRSSSDTTSNEQEASKRKKLLTHLTKPVIDPMAAVSTAYQVKIPQLSREISSKSSMESSTVLLKRKSSNPVDIRLSRRENSDYGSRAKSTSYPVFLISDDDQPSGQSSLPLLSSSLKHIQSSSPQTSSSYMFKIAQHSAFKLSERDEQNIVNTILKLDDKLIAAHQAILMAKDVLCQTHQSLPSNIIGREWWHYILFKYPNLRTSIVDFFRRKQSQVAASNYVESRQQSVLKQFSCGVIRNDNYTNGSDNINNVISITTAAADVKVGIKEMRQSNVEERKPVDTSSSISPWISQQNDIGRDASTQQEIDKNAFSTHQSFTLKRKKPFFQLSQSATFACDMDTSNVRKSERIARRKID